MKYYRRYVGDYLRDTARLSMMEHGAYTLLLDYYYADEKPLPTDKNELYTMVRAMTPADRKAVDKVLSLYFISTGDGHRNARADREMEKAQPAIEAARVNGKRGGRPPKNPAKNPVGYLMREPNGFDSENPSGLEAGIQPPTTNHQPPSPKPPTTRRQEKSKGAAAPLPDWVPLPQWHAYVEMRKKIKKQLTEDAVPLALKKLDELRAEGHAPADVLEWAVFNSYQGLFPPKSQGNARPTVTAGNVAAAQEWLRREEEKDSHENPAA